MIDEDFEKRACKAEAKFAELHAAGTMLLALAKDLEWVHAYHADGDYPTCLSCGADGIGASIAGWPPVAPASEEGIHEDDCKLTSAIKSMAKALE